MTLLIWVIELMLRICDQSDFANSIAHTFRSTWIEEHAVTVNSNLNLGAQKTRGRASARRKS